MVSSCSHQVPNDYSLHSQFVSQVCHSSTLYPICCEWSFFLLPFWFWEHKCKMKAFCKLKHETWIKWSLFDMLVDSTQLNSTKSKLKHRFDAYSVPLRDFSFFTYWIFWSWWIVSQEIVISLHPQQFSMANLPTHFNTKWHYFSY
jgi:hypothetical protein